ncbi:antigen EM13-like isoform X2 [Mercenaria mercenaria]|uniref:antigen EM13-like isoform X2 n=1 Tax=Mercenaria mercenaria TaxID=6596 RepID=UPI00234EC509|nr:antigen EM13-like isoform X2 [Mercenaria mercenaria]
MVLEGGKVARVSQEPSSDTGVISEMSINNGDEPVQASSDSFWEVGKYARTVTRIDNGYKLCSSLKQLITSRAEIEKAYAKQLSQWSKKWNDFLDKGPEYGTTQGAWRGVLEESDKLADLHTEVGDKLVNNVTTSIKQWQKENYHKSMMHFKETKELDDQFKKVQKPWEKKLNKVLTAKKDYHAACRNEKSTANQENNARADTAMSSDQIESGTASPRLKKLQEKLKKCQIEVESTQEKYNACLNDLNGYNSKYIEDMTEVFEKCQAFERQRIDFFKKIMFDIHQCLDLSVDSRYSSVYTTLHSTISNTDADKDLRWWSNNHGADMAMAWPVFEVPTTGKVTKKKRQYDAGLIAKAYEDVVSSGMSVYKAARLYGIPESTLRDRTLGIQPVTGEKENLPSCGPSPIFTAQEEQKLVEHSSDMASIGYGYTRAEFLSLAFEWAVTLGRKKQSDPEFAASWYTGFKRRNPDFTLAKPQRRSIGTAKTAPSTISIGSTGEEEQSISDNLEPAEHVSFFDSKKILKVLETSEGTRKRRATITCDLSSPSKKMLMTPVEIEVTIKDKNVLELPGPSGEKDVPKKSTKRVQKAPLSPIPGPSGDSNSLESEEDLDSEDITEKDLCCVCGKFTPEPMNMTDTLELVQWGQCDKCGHWTHLKYCCNVKILRKHEEFLCHHCV